MGDVSGAHAPTGLETLRECVGRLDILNMADEDAGGFCVLESGPLRMRLGDTRTGSTP
jgi:hypothetical protein